MDDQANIKVFTRFRPLNDRELQISQSCCVNFLDSMTVSVTSSHENAEPMKFTFDRAFTPNESQKNVYEIAAKPIVDAVMQGFNGTVLAYGQTSSGKTFTMSGPDFEDDELMGIIPRMVTTVFDNICAADEHVEFSVKVAYCEIYLEKIKDLLNLSKVNLKIHEDRTRGIFIDGLTEVYVSNDKEVYELMLAGSDNREVAYTSMNAGSSRSHSLFLLTVGQTNSKDCCGKVGKLYLVDLAGSEKISKTGAAGKRLEEAKNINKSLTVLGQVIYSLTDGKSTHIPYRDSKLTRVLQDSLGGNSKTCLIVTCSPSPFNEAETVSTLRFGVRAKAIKNKPKVNREYTVAELKLMLSKAQEEIEKKNKIIARLEDNLKKLGGHVSVTFDEKSEIGEGKIDYDEVMAEIDDLRSRLNEEIEINSSLSDVKMKLHQETEGTRADNESLMLQTNALNEKVLDYETTLKEQEMLIEKLAITKETLETDYEQILKAKISLEQLLNERDLEISELKLHCPSNTKLTSSTIYDLRSQLEYEKEMNLELKNKTKQLEASLEESTKVLQKSGTNIQEILIVQAVARVKKVWDDERKSILKDLKNRINKVIELEIALDSAKERYEALENTLTLGEKNLKKKTEVLSKNLEQLGFLYHQLMNEKATSKVDLKILERKVARISDKNASLEEEIKKYKALLAQAESKMRMFEDELSYPNSSRISANNSSRMIKGSLLPHIKKTIKGGQDSARHSYLLE